MKKYIYWMMIIIYDKKIVIFFLNINLFWYIYKRKYIWFFEFIFVMFIYDKFLEYICILEFYKVDIFIMI